MAQNNLSTDFIDFFHFYFKGKKIEEEIDLNLRFYISILQSYIEYLKTPDISIIKEWKEEIKPFLLKIYPFEQSGIFNINADIKFLINDIDNIIEQSEIENINIDNVLKEDINIIYEDNDEYEDDLDLLKIDIEEKLNNKKNKIKKFKNDYKDDYDIKRLKKPFEFTKHSPTLASKSTSASLNDEINEKNDQSKIRYSCAVTTKMTLPKIKEITPHFSDEFETQGITIFKKKNLIAQMTFNLLLKKIVTSNFFDEFLDYTINFTEQCFYFMKREIVFKKIIDCYNYYTQIKVPFDQRKKLINFMSLLVIKLYNCYTKIDEKEEVAIIIKQFYNDRINEIKPFISKYQKTGNKIQELFLGGINYIKNSVNKLVNNIDNNNTQKLKDKENEHDNVGIKDNLNILLNRRKQLMEEQNQKNIIFEEKKINKERVKEKEEKKEKDEKKEKEKEEKKEKGMAIEEKTLSECEKIVNIIKSRAPKPDILSQTEDSLYIIKLQKSLNLKKEKTNSKEEKQLHKSKTQRTLKVLTLEGKKTKTKSIFDIKKTKKSYFSCFDYDIIEISEALIHFSLKSLKKIKRKELYNGAFLKKSKLITSPNVIENINNFNKLISFIIEDILSYDYPQDRARVIERWVYISEYLKSRKDYNDILAIDSALKNYLITGLNLTWKELSTKTKKMINDLDIFCSFEKNYKNFRDDMNLLNKNEFYVPYLGMLLKDLNFYEENYKYIVNGNMINFEKINGIQKTIDDFFYFKNIKDKAKINLNEDLNFFENLDDKKESYLEDIANKLEPKFTLYNNPKKIKRLTFIDKNYFRGNQKRGSLNESIKLNVD